MGDNINKYYINGTHIENINIGAVGNSHSSGITQNGTYFWVSDSSDALVYKYYMNGTYTGSNFSTSSSGNNDPIGITQNGTYFWIADSSDSLVYKYYMNGTYTGSNFSTLSSGNDDITGITQNGTYFWIADYSDALVYKYSMADLESPTYSSNSVDSTEIGSSTVFSLTINDNVALHNSGYYKFSTNNTGIWVNDSSINFITTPQTIETTKTLNSTAGISIGYRWYLYDNAGNFNSTSIYSLITTSDSTAPTYSSNSVDNTNAGSSTSFSIIVNDDVALHNSGYYKFSTNNTGIWVNDSSINFITTPQTIETTKTLNSTAGISIGYRWYLYDNAGNLAVTSIYKLKTIEAGSEEETTTTTTTTTTTPSTTSIITNYSTLYIPEALNEEYWIQTNLVQNNTISYSDKYSIYNASTLEIIALEKIRKYPNTETNPVIIQSFVIRLEEKQRSKFVIKNDICNLGLAKLENNEAIIHINTEYGKFVIQKKFHEKRLKYFSKVEYTDINDDGLNDIGISIEKLDKSGAQIKVDLIYNILLTDEEIQEKESLEKRNKIVGAIIMFGAVIFLILRLRKSLKNI
jgi:uncharacterized protein YcfL